ncbi:dihydroxyacetone kinase [Nadsonia fulvescens var. elongata DSM 6958]|uniref:Dihydroxyacetone kinase n=1 Tax=Nadsonia fulvescens var. elongata DSM 6958 TaxID=857566 RepID=A0A1E3PGZ4_9ASCO|nr:dihydroxyacetone kinase [Nadsonia fulvescens var. elongata DSM 6958]
MPVGAKQFPSSTTDIINTALRGVLRANPDFSLIESDKVVFLTSSAGANDKVTLISGGGSGHEPTHAGFVGTGALSAAVAGSVFASPSTKQIYAGLKAVESTKGSLIIVKNYTGDVLHFGLAAERVRAHGGNVEVVVVGDDVAVGRKQGGLVGRRGLAATCLVHKVAGASAQNGDDLSTVTGVAKAIASNVVTIGSSLDHCNVPGRPFETNLKDNEMEIGMGIHNEPGVKKVSPIPSTSDLIKNELLPLLLSKEDEDRYFVPFNKGEESVLVVNNLGGLSNLELSAIAETTIQQLASDYSVTPVRVIVGTLITALNGAGFSLSLLNATKASKEAGQDVLALLDAPTSAPGWPARANSSGKSSKDLNLVKGEEIPKDEKDSGISANADSIAAFLKAGIEAINEKEPLITRYDTVAGDGDCGETLVNGGKALLKALEDKSIRLSDGVNGIVDISDIVEDSMGGTSGGLYSIFLHALAHGIRTSGQKELSLENFASSSKIALDSLYQYTSARAGDRTLIDTLEPFVVTLGSEKDLAKAVKAANEGAESTRKLEAKFGRASYVSKDEFKEFDKEGGLPDPGAIGLAALLNGFLSAYQK